jgi:hypothetical protein
MVGKKFNVFLSMNKITDYLFVIRTEKHYKFINVLMTKISIKYMLVFKANESTNKRGTQISRWQNKGIE